MRKILFLLLLIPLLLNGQIAGGDYYVSTTGNDSNDGSFASPFLTPQKAVTVAQPGDTVYIRGGTYQPVAHIGATGAAFMLFRPEQSIGMSGTLEDGDICYFAYTGETVIFDGSLLGCVSGFNQGVVAEYVERLHFKGITIRNLFQVPYDPIADRYSQAMGWAFEGCANITFEQCNVHDVNGRGFFYASGSWNPENFWVGGIYYPPYFLTDTTSWINCDAYNLVDSLAVNFGNAADGWKVQGYEGNFLTWSGCRAWFYADDAIDPSGDCFRVFDNCWAMATAKYSYGGIEGNGFKTTGVNREYYDSATYFDNDYHYAIFKNCIAVFCAGGSGGTGYMNNYGTAGDDYFSNKAEFYNNIAYKCKIGFWDIGGSIYDGNTTYKNNLSYGSISVESGDGRPYDALIRGIPSVQHHNTWEKYTLYPYFDTSDTVTVNNADFITLDSLTIVSQLTAARWADGRLPEITAFRLEGTSDLIGAGTDVGMTATPDIGVDWAYYDLTYGAGEEEPPAGDVVPTIYTNAVTNYNVRYGTSGGNVTSDGGATITERGICWGTSANPTTAGTHLVVAGTTGSFTGQITGLSSNTTYHVRSYATNAEGTSYGADYVFTTPTYTPLTNSTGEPYYYQGKINIIK